MDLLLSPALEQSKSDLISEITAGLPSIGGGPVSVSALPQLTAHAGKLLSQATGKGTAVYAASFIRQRSIVLETSLLDDEPLFRLILVHEIFHFSWARLSNGKRAQYAALIRKELAQHAAGELGESSAVRKQFATDCDRHWKSYVCESFCDTAAYLYAGVTSHPSFRLAKRWTQYRARWFTLNVQAIN